MMKPDDRARWDDILLRLRVQQAMSGADDPLLFHGTTQKAAAAIVDGGFDPTTSWVSSRDDQGNPTGPKPCVYWTTDIVTAVRFAEMQSGEARGFLVIFSARLSGLAKSGTLAPEWNAWEIDMDEDPDQRPTDWRDSLDRFSSVAVVDCRVVPGLALHAATPTDIGPDPDYIARKADEHIAEARSPEEPTVETVRLPRP